MYTSPGFSGFAHSLHHSDASFCSVKLNPYPLSARCLLTLSAAPQQDYYSITANSAHAAGLAAGAG
jgi:hypothetical protein